MTKYLFTILIILNSQYLFAQGVTFGKVGIDELKLTSYAKEKNVPALVLYDKGKIE